MGEATKAPAERTQTCGFGWFRAVRSAWRDWRLLRRGARSEEMRTHRFRRVRRALMARARRLLHPPSSAGGASARASRSTAAAGSETGGCAGAATCGRARSVHELRRLSAARLQPRVSRSSVSCASLSSSVSGFELRSDGDASDSFSGASCCNFAAGEDAASLPALFLRANRGNLLYSLSQSAVASSSTSSRMPSCTAWSMYPFGVMAFVLGAVFLIVPNLMLLGLGVQPALDDARSQGALTLLFVRLTSVAAINVGILYCVVSYCEVSRFFEITVPCRLLTCLCFSTLYLAGKAPKGLLAVARCGRAMHCNVTTRPYLENRSASRSDYFTPHPAVAASKREREIVLAIVECV
eukprot:TRINITY_DN21125_c0_g1_i2.p1 TRINITY_DN21125_c0_g1~~TRINITY_DN21125_c0_g1_i2.p1  ORF type:complete len:368 (+),score=49.25 TRINITY_DN21125_c0_g1_i2:48-1106(+)